MVALQESGETEHQLLKPSAILMFLSLSHSSVETDTSKFNCTLDSVSQDLSRAVLTERLNPLPVAVWGLSETFLIL